MVGILTLGAPTGAWDCVGQLRNFKKSLALDRIEEGYTQAQQSTCSRRRKARGSIAGVVVYQVQSSLLASNILSSAATALATTRCNKLSSPRHIDMHAHQHQLFPQPWRIYNHIPCLCHPVSASKQTWSRAHRTPLYVTPANSCIPADQKPNPTDSSSLSHRFAGVY